MVFHLYNRQIASYVAQVYHELSSLYTLMHPDTNKILAASERMDLDPTDRIALRQDLTNISQSLQIMSKRYDDFHITRGFAQKHTGSCSYRSSRAY